MDKRSHITQFKDAFTVEGPLSAFCLGYEAPTYGRDGEIDGIVRVLKIERETNTIWLESVSANDYPRQ